ncbi:uncharacterized protein LOC110442809 isoform X2 [Mizuhopecten yessoensis]|uniref:Kyphoscoliosis peptidase n=1 Tax=Mizuhopecten yessoensis TaxID=6573 RepID=A0A210PGC2_MIZYE|nr:uncharacterized protein LOC110442809 isoform X2 [Mizuhopecten yessoensis]OWF35540.1 Kyphoscoliosis peptidase [Mizuhopecten yessoensis]
MGSGSSSATKAEQRPATSPNVGKTGMNGTAAAPPVSRTPRSALPGTRTAAGNGDDHAKKTKLPPPVPSKMAKDEVFLVDDYRHVETYVLNAPTSVLMGSFKDLIKYLTANENWDDVAKARAIFRWVTSIDVFALVVEEEPPPQSPLEYFLKIKNNLGNHAHLISGLCQMAGIPCVIISGMNKSAAFEVGGKVDRKSMGAQWNAVYVKGEWRFLDAFWASACVVGKKSGEWTLIDSDGNITQDEDDTSDGETQHRINEFYFLPDPKQFIWTHFPDEGQWQLLETQITTKEFETHVYVRERFYYLGMSFNENSEQKCLLNADDGVVQLAFNIPFRDSEHFRYKYMLYQAKSSGGDQTSDMVLDRFVMFEHTAETLRFALRFPMKGKFKMDIFGLDVRDSDIFDLTCTYVISCSTPQKNCQPLPDCPAIGWGPGADAKKAGLTAKSHGSAVITTEDGVVDIKLGSHKDVQLHQLLKNTMVDEATLSKYALVREENGEFIVSIRLPQTGEYGIKLYCNDEGEGGDAENVLNYLIQSLNNEIHNKPFPNIIDGRLGKKPFADVLGVKMMSHTNSKLETKDGKLKMNFIAKNNLDLLCELHTIDAEATKQMSMIVREVNGKWTFDCDLPVAGEYSINVFTRQKNGGPRVYNTHSYLVASDGHSVGNEKGDDSKSVSSDTDESKIIMETVQTSDSEILIPIPHGYDEVLASYQRRHANDPPNDDEVKVVKQDLMKFFSAKMEEYGDYMLDLYQRDSGSRIIKHIAKYQVDRKPASELFEDNAKLLMSNLGMEPEEDTASYGETDEEKNRRTAKKMIQRAMDLKDIELLTRGLFAYESTDPPDMDKDPLIKKAKRLLELLQAKQDLNSASSKRDLKALTSAIERAKAANYDNLLDLQIAMASRLKDQLMRIEKLRHSVLSMDQKTVSEIRTYSNPPDGVHQSLMATFLLLGNPKKDVKVWRTCQAILGKSGKESVMRKISQFDPKDCFLDVALAARKAIEPYSLETIRDVSAGAATFYVWSKGMIEEVENTGGAQVKDGMAGGGSKKTKSVPNKKR